MIPHFRTSKRRILFYLSFFIITGLSGFVFVQLFKVHTIPKDYRLVPGQELSLNLSKPFSIYLPAERPQGITGFIGKEILPLGRSGSCSMVTVRPEREGESFLELRFLGVPLRRVNVKIARMPQVIPGGHAIGILMADQGVLVVGHLPVRNTEGVECYPAKEADIRVGDLLVSINRYPINRLEDVDPLVQAHSQEGKPLSITLLRNGVKKEVTVYPVKRRHDTPQGPKNTYLLGLYVEDPAAGVGTLTYFNPSTRRFGALGHKVVGFGSREVPLIRGKVVSARITGINQSNRGEPGEKIGVFTGSQDIIGEISANTSLGIFGTLHINVVNSLYQEAIPVAAISQVQIGPAEILTVLSGREISRFSIEIQRVYHQSAARDKGLIIKVTDPALLRKTGGIVQGMSGSPIIQDGKLVGAVTHVFVNDPTRGYGVFAEWMMQTEDQTIPSEEKRVS